MVVAVGPGYKAGGFGWAVWERGHDRGLGKWAGVGGRDERTSASNQ